jgi:hypothetical protein
MAQRLKKIEPERGSWVEAVINELARDLTYAHHSIETIDAYSTYDSHVGSIKIIINICKKPEDLYQKCVYVLFDGKQWYTIAGLSENGFIPIWFCGGYTSTVSALEKITEDYITNIIAACYKFNIEERYKLIGELVANKYVDSCFINDLNSSTIKNPIKGLEPLGAILNAFSRLNPSKYFKSCEMTISHILNIKKSMTDESKTECAIHNEPCIESETIVS